MLYLTYTTMTGPGQSSEPLTEEHVRRVAAWAHLMGWGPKFGPSCGKSISRNDYSPAAVEFYFKSNLQYF